MSSQIYPILHAAQSQEDPSLMNLREILVQQQQHHQQHLQSPSQQPQQQTLSQAKPPSQPSHVDSSQDQPHDNDIDPQISAGLSPTSLHDSIDQQDADGKKSRRELSGTKRAAQNRAAQRAFRQRKEQYIMTLKAQVQGFEGMASNYKILEKDNLLLREYIIRLQSRLLELGTEIPQPPPELQKDHAPSSPNMAINSVPTHHSVLDQSLQHEVDEDMERGDDVEDDSQREHKMRDVNAQLQEAAEAAARHIHVEGQAE